MGRRQCAAPLFLRKRTMRNVAIFASAILVSGLMAEPLNAYEMPNLSDPKVIAAVTRFSWRSNARIATVRMAPAASISPGACSTPSVFISIADGREKNGIACRHGARC
jgi:hypothetical protein